MTLKQKIDRFDPNAPATHEAHLFGLPFSAEEARCVVVPVPWEVTVSYRAGTAKGPQSILKASKQVDLFDPELPKAWKLGVAMDEMPLVLQRQGQRLRRDAEIYLAQSSKGHHSPQSGMHLQAINQGCHQMVDHVRRVTGKWLDRGKMVALIGGDHSTPLGFLQALAERHRALGVLHLDAHADLRNAYEGFDYSHASIMLNALKIGAIRRLVQVGIRDYCEEEVECIRKSKGRVITHFERDMRREIFRGGAIETIYTRIIKDLPKDVYVSFDIDALDPKLCPHTGTPVPGGFAFEEALFLVHGLVRSGRRIIGFDINEVSPGDDEWDANVGARLLFRLINLMAKSQKIRL